MFDDLMKQINKNNDITPITTQTPKKEAPYREKNSFEKTEKQAINILETLNEEQYASATSTSKHNLVIASAGTGKTSTIIGRVTFLLENGIKPEQIVMLTFTAKAGKEMIERLTKIHGSKIASKIFAGTFHAYGNSLMKLAGDRRKLKKPHESIALFSSIYSKLAKKYMINEEVAYRASSVYGYYNLYLNKTALETSFNDWLSIKLEKNKEQQDFIFFYEMVTTEYENEKDKYNLMDFNDLLFVVKEYYEKNPNNLKELIVDEYQDTNYLQNKLLKKISENTSLFCVGDYDQSIYAFNGSDVSILGSFTDIYADSKVLSLNKNYRSSKPILEVAEKVIQFNERLYPKRLEPTKQGTHGAPKLRKYYSDKEQYDGVADEVQKLLQEGVEPSEIAVLYRGNTSGERVETSMLLKGIEVDRIDDKSFLESKDVSIVLSCYKTLTDCANVVDFIKVGKMIKDVDEVVLKKLYDNAVALGHGNYHKGILNPNFSDENISHLDGESKEIFTMNQRHLKGSSPSIIHTVLYSAKSLKMFDEYMGLYEKTKNIQKPFIIIELIFESKFYKKFLEVLVSDMMKFSPKEEAILKKEIQERHEILKKIASQFSSVRDFNKKINAGKQKIESEGVKLLTVHASKGLEYKHVFVVDNVEERFPNYKLANDSGGGLEEERRLFYVAVTRAKDMLVLTMPENKMTKDGLKPHKPSVFLKEAELI